MIDIFIEKHFQKSTNIKCIPFSSKNNKTKRLNQFAELKSKNLIPNHNPETFYPGLKVKI